jgi:hypothetical protein
MHNKNFVFIGTGISNAQQKLRFIGTGILNAQQKLRFYWHRHFECTTKTTFLLAQAFRMHNKNYVFIGTGILNAQQKLRFYWHRHFEHFEHLE